MKCSDCKRYKTKKCYSNPSGEDHDWVENLSCFVPKDSKSIGQEKPHKAPKINIRTVFRLNISTIILLIANIVTIVFAIIHRWDIGDVIWIYWAQSVIIGVFHIFLIMSLKQFSTKGYDLPGQPIPATRSTQYQAATYFIICYGLLHFAFFVFLKIYG